MKIFVVNTAASSGGALSILTDFYNNVKESDKINEWIFLLSGNYIKETKNIKVIVDKELKRKVNRLKFDNYNGFQYIKKHKPDVVFSMQNTTIRNLDVPQILYLHQSIPFQKVKKFSFFKRDELSLAIIQKVLGNLIRKGLYSADRIIVQTNWMKNAITTTEDLSSDKVSVVPPTIRKLKSEKLNIKNNNFFYPTSDNLYKNIEILNKAAELIDSDSQNYEYNIEITIDRKMPNKNLNSIGTISREKVLEKLHQNVLVFPSYIETFGLPLAEGRLVGTTILASDTAFSREVLNGYKNVYYFDPFDAQELANLMKKCISGEIENTKENSADIPLINAWNEVREVIYEMV